jgi:hypothetical protein
MSTPTPNQTLPPSDDDDDEFVMSEDRLELLPDLADVPVVDVTLMDDLQPEMGQDEEAAR